MKKKVFGVVALLAVLLIAFGGGRTVLSSFTVAQRDLSETVVATGEVTSDVDLSLGFEKSGMVESINVSLGDYVKKGQTLMKLSLDGDEANLTIARGSLLKAEAEYNKAVSLTSDDGLSELELENEKIRQDQLVANAYNTLLSSGLEAIPDGSGDYGEAPIVSGSYTCTTEGEYNIELYASGSESGYSFRVSGLESDSGTVLSDSTEPFGTCGLKIVFPENFDRQGEWVIEIPNKSGDSYSTNLGNYNLALAVRESTISELEKELSIEGGSSATGDVAIAYANLVSAQGEYQSALAKVNEGIVRSPAEGVITKININEGDLVQAYESVVTVQDVDALYVVANINEANISSVSRGQAVEVMFDAFGPEEKLLGYIESVDVAPSKEDGVVNYEIAVSMEKNDLIKPGMTSTVFVVVGEKIGAVAIPSNSLVFEEEISKVLVSEDGKKSKVVELGMRGDDGYVEVVSGLVAGDVIYLPE